jgi:peroxiredoxin
MPVLQAYYARHKNDGFTVIAIEDGEPAVEVKAFVEAHQLTFSVWLDPSHLASEQGFKTMSLPSSYVIDRTGLVRLAWFGAISNANLERYVTPIIREKN